MKPLRFLGGGVLLLALVMVHPPTSASSISPTLGEHHHRSRKTEDVNSSGLDSDRVAQSAALRTEIRGFLRKTKKVAEKSGLTADRYDLLVMTQAACDRGEQPTVTSLCAQMHMNATACAELVNRAVEAGLLSKCQSSEDRREFYLSLTLDGQHRLAATMDALSADRGQFLETLRRIAGLLSA